MDQFTLLISAILGGVIGYERQSSNHEAGIRTFALISLGACLAAYLSGLTTGDSGRISAQIVSGIGFLGAGIIMHSEDKVFGLTTAACAWLVAMIGMSCGMHEYLKAVETTIIAWIVLRILNKFKNI